MLAEEVFTLEEVGKHLRVPVEAVQQEIKSGRLRALVVAGEHYRVREHDLALYKDGAYAQPAAPTSQPSPPTDSGVNLSAAPNFDYTWPDKKFERYTAVSEGVSSFGGKEYHVKLGFTVRRSSGKERARALVLVDRYPTVEFVAASEKVGPEELLAGIIKDRNGKQLPVGATLPPEYVGMNVGPFREIIDGPGAKNGLAVICQASDRETMVKHALIRYRFREERA